MIHSMFSIHALEVTFSLYFPNSSFRKSGIFFFGIFELLLENIGLHV